MAELRRHAARRYEELTPPATPPLSSVGTARVADTKDKPWLKQSRYSHRTAMNIIFVVETTRWLVPLLVSWSITVGLIFGGCCSNVWALESIVKEEPGTGILITFAQFVITALFTWPSHFSTKHPPFFLKPPAVPLHRWLPNIALFMSVNLLNNFAFGYNISVPVHIILRSGGSITTMIVGFIWGKRFTRIQVLSVAFLTLGIVVAAYSDAQSKGKTNPASSYNSITDFNVGLLILLLAQILSAIMGIYTEETYRRYGKHWQENLFYMHFLSVPLFLPFLPKLRIQAAQLASSRPFILPSFLAGRLPESFQKDFFPSWTPGSTMTFDNLPTHIVMLILNAFTQYGCIGGVNMLGARTTALGVSIVLNVRKLVSLMVSIWLFGNELPVGILTGATVVFGSGALYAWEGTRRNRMAGRTARTARTE